MDFETCIADETGIRTNWEPVGLIFPYSAMVLRDDPTAALTADY
jgi:hypothetical protein